MKTKCSVKECEGKVVGFGLCDKHYRRMKQYGDTEATKRPSDWGQRNKHPLYGIWKSFNRAVGKGVSEEWKDFWQFVRDVGPRPAGDYRAARQDDSQPYGPNNFYWSKNLVPKLADETEKEYQRRHQETYRRIHPERTWSYDLQKSFGITSEDYNVLSETQNHVCAICGNAEKDRHSKDSTKTRRLAVDHCHTTQKIRGLLCGNCNKGLGNFKDDLTRLKQAIIYLEKHQ